MPVWNELASTRESRLIMLLILMYIILVLMWPVWSRSRWTFGTIAIRVFCNSALCSLCSTLFHFDLAHWRLPPLGGRFLWLSGSTVTVQSPSSNTPNVVVLEIYAGVNRKARCLQTRDTNNSPLSWSLLRPYLGEIDDGAHRGTLCHHTSGLQQRA